MYMVMRRNVILTHSARLRRVKLSNLRGRYNTDNGRVGCRTEKCYAKSLPRQRNKGVQMTHIYSLAWQTT